MGVFPSPLRHAKITTPTKRCWREPLTGALRMLLHVDIFQCRFRSFEAYSSIDSSKMISDPPESPTSTSCSSNSTGSSVIDRRLSPDVGGNSSSLGTSVTMPSQNYKYWSWHHFHYSRVDWWSSITLFKSKTMLCGTDGDPRNIPHIQTGCGEHPGIFGGIMSIPQKTVMDPNNVMSFTSQRSLMSWMTMYYHIGSRWEESPCMCREEERTVKEAWEGRGQTKWIRDLAATGGDAHDLLLQDSPYHLLHSRLRKRSGFCLVVTISWPFYGSSDRLWSHWFPTGRVPTQVWVGKPGSEGGVGRAGRSWAKWRYDLAHGPTSGERCSWFAPTR